MTRFSDPVAKVLRKAGWRPGRAVPGEQLSAWADQLAGFAMFDSARRVLGEFGGLSVDQRGPGETCARERFELDPLLALHEQDRFELFADSHGLRLYPVGEAAGGHYFLAVDPDGGTYLVMDDIQLVGRTFDEALEALIRGRRPTPLE